MQSHSAANKQEYYSSSRNSLHKYDGYLYEGVRKGLTSAFMLNNEPYQRYVPNITVIPSLTHTHTLKPNQYSSSYFIRIF